MAPLRTCRAAALLLSLALTAAVVEGGDSLVHTPPRAGDDGSHPQDAAEGSPSRRPLADRKRELETFLKTSHLSDLPLDEQTTVVPEYMEALYEEFEHEDMSGAPAPLSDQKVWGMRPEKVDMSNHRVELSFPIHEDIKPEDLTSAELVLARRHKDVHGNASLTHVRLCLHTDRTPSTSRQCFVTHGVEQQLPVVVRGRTYDVYNVTGILRSWLLAAGSLVGGREAILHLSRRLVHGQYEIPVAGGQNTLLVAYHNVPDALHLSSTATADAENQGAHRTHIRSRRNAPTHFQPRRSDFTELTELHFGNGDVFGEVAATGARAGAGAGGRSSRSRRETHCQLHEWWVSFEYMGWNEWVVAPTRYEANQCYGYCSSLRTEHRVRASAHAIVKSLYGEASRIRSQTGSAQPPICCAPVTYAPLSIMFRNPNQTVSVNRLAQMTVTLCGCL